MEGGIPVNSRVTNGRQRWKGRQDVFLQVVTVSIMSLLLLSCKAGGPDDSTLAKHHKFQDGKGIYDSVARIIAIGDVHGDYEGLITRLQRLDIIDQNKDWIAGSTWVVQTGDVLDRGDGERQTFALIEKLRRQSLQRGGRFIALNGNHEFMQAQGIFDYASEAALADGRWKNRLRYYRPGSRGAKKLATRNIAVKIGRTVFTHGALPFAIERETYHQGEPVITGLNRKSRQWLMRRPSIAFPQLVGDSMAENKEVLVKYQQAMEKSLDHDVFVTIWSRLFSKPADTEVSAFKCRLLDTALSLVDADRLVVGHSKQNTVNTACDGKVWRIELNEESSALEIREDHVGEVTFSVL